MVYIYPLNNPGGVHLTVLDFTHLSPPPNITNITVLTIVYSYLNNILCFPN